MRLIERKTGREGERKREREREKVSERPKCKGGGDISIYVPVSSVQNHIQQIYQCPPGKPEKTWNTPVAEQLGLLLLFVRDTTHHRKPFGVSVKVCWEELALEIGLVLGDFTNNLRTWDFTLNSMLSRSRDSV